MSSSMRLLLHMFYVALIVTQEKPVECFCQLEMRSQNHWLRLWLPNDKALRGVEERQVRWAPDLLSNSF